MNSKISKILKIIGIILYILFVIFNLLALCTCIIYHLKTLPIWLINVILNIANIILRIIYRKKSNDI